MDAKKGKIDFNTDIHGDIKVGIGKVSFGSEKLEQNFVLLN